MEKTMIDAETTGKVLTALPGIIQANNTPQALYLTGRCSEQFINSFGIRQAPLPDFLKNYGIRSITLGDWPDPALLSSAGPDQQKLFFQQCRTIAFDDWSEIANASTLWYRLLSDVIKPLKKTDLEFIFYLGDPAKMKFFQVDEILDIISGFSYYGRVTFVLDEFEAGKLWALLNGAVFRESSNSGNSLSADLKSQYLSIFRTMTIHRLLIYSDSYAMTFSKEEECIFARHKSDSGSGDYTGARDNFVEGYCMGLLLQQDLTFCIALGLANLLVS